MIGIGLRVYSNSKVYYAIIDKRPSGALKYRNVDFLNVPLALEPPDRFNFIRNIILDILIEYSVESAVLRLSEKPASLTSSVVDRYFLEGVIQEALASCSVDKFRVGPISVLSGLLKWPRDDFKKYAEAEKHLDGFEWTKDWKKLSKEERESVLACLASLNL